MNEPGRYDVIIIGSGAGGATTAWRLAATGKRVLVLKRGDYLPREAENWNSDAVFVRNRYKTTERWLDRSGRSFMPATHYCVGGIPRFTARRCSGCANATSARRGTGTASRRSGR